MDKLKKKMDLESIDELISLCEDKMVSPFKKKKPDAVVVAVEEDEDEVSEKPDLGEMDMDDLIRMYEEMKSKKSEEE